MLKYCKKPNTLTKFAHVLDSHTGKLKHTFEVLNSHELRQMNLEVKNEVNIFERYL